MKPCNYIMHKRSCNYKSHYRPVLLCNLPTYVTDWHSWSAYTYVDLPLCHAIPDSSSYHSFQCCYHQLLLYSFMAVPHSPSPSRPFLSSPHCPSPSLSSFLCPLPSSPPSPVPCAPHPQRLWRVKRAAWKVILSLAPATPAIP